MWILQIALRQASLPLQAQTRDQSMNALQALLLRVPDPLKCFRRGLHGLHQLRCCQRRYCALCGRDRNDHVIDALCVLACLDCRQCALLAKLHLRCCRWSSLGRVPMGLHCLQMHWGDCHLGCVARRDHHAHGGLHRVHDDLHREVRVHRATRCAVLNCSIQKHPH